MQPYDIRMAECLSTRLCHDLAGPIGAISNGAEFLAEDASMQEEALALIVSSGKEAVARLQFYRQAYGKLNDHGEASLQEKKKLTEELLAQTKIVLDWPETSTDGAGISVSQKMGRLLLNMIVPVSRTLMKGGTLSVRVEEDANKARKMTVRATAGAVKDDDETLAVLAGDDAVPLSPKSVQAYLTRQLAKEMDITLHLEREAGSLSLVASRSA